MNTVGITGRIAQDLNLKTTSTDKQYCRFRIAVRKRGKNDTDFFTVILWGKYAEHIVKYGYKGALVAVSGSLSATRYQTKDGTNKEDVEIVAETVEILEYKKEAEASPDPVKAQASQIAKQPTIDQISTDDLEGLDLPFEF